MENGERRAGFLPVTARDMAARGWDQADFVYVTGDAYVDHPSFGVSILSRVLESHGFRVAILAQPDYRSTEDFKRFGRPRLGFLVTSGNIDSMVAHYTVARLRRTSDYYSPGGRTGHRPDRAVIVYCNRIREAYGDIPIAIGGLEASLRRFAHYDYWEDRIRRSILIDARADLLLYGMGERAIVRLAELLDRGVPIRRIRDLRGSVYLARRGDPVFYPCTECGEFSQIRENGEAYARAFRIQYDNQDAVTGRAVVEYYDDKMLVANPPACRQLKRSVFRSRITVVASAPATSAPLPFIRGGRSVHAVRRVCCVRLRCWRRVRISRDISTMWAVRRPISASRHAKSKGRRASALRGNACIRSLARSCG